MFKNMKLSIKITAGFVAIIFIAILLGLYCSISMKNAEGLAKKLNKEYVPEVTVANDIERASFNVMYAMRGYGYTGEEDFLKTSKEKMKELNTHLSNAQEHSEKYDGLEQLKENSATAKKYIDEYTDLIEETQKTIQELDNIVKNLNQAAMTYMSICNNFLANQNKKMLQDINSGIKQNQKIGLKKITIVNDIIDIGNATRIGTFKSQAERDPILLKNTINNFSKVDQNFEKLRQITNNRNELDQIDKTQKASNDYKNNMQNYLDKWNYLQDLNTKRTEVGSKVLNAAKATAQDGMKQTKNIASVTSSSLSCSVNIMIIGLIIAVIAGSLLAYFIVIGITKPINQIVTGLNDGSQQVASASAQVSSSSQQLAEGSSEQASSIEEISSTLEESASMTRQNTENTKQAALLAKQTKDSAIKGNSEMNKMMQSMEDIKKSSGEIGKIIKVIDEIAFQTNILALNAAVEAARAGEAGQGFAVVAEEVRNLAQRSAQAAKDTAGIIESNIKLSEQGEEISKGVLDACTEINDHAQKVNDLLEEISAASQEQSQGIEQINKAITQMEQVVQENAANAEESASASEELSSQAENMKEIVNALVSLVEGANAAREQAKSFITTQKVVSKKIASNTNKQPNKNTKIVNPEDVIPLEDNLSGF